jgi:hypothetical protein
MSRTSNGEAASSGGSSVDAEEIPKMETTEGNLVCGRNKAKALLAEREEQAKRQRSLELVTEAIQKKNVLLMEQQKVMLEQQKLQLVMMLDANDPRRVAFINDRLKELFP